MPLLLHTSQVLAIFQVSAKRASFQLMHEQLQDHKNAKGCIAYSYGGNRPASDHLYSPSVLEASGGEVEEWIQRPAFEAALFSFFPCTDILPSAASQVRLICHASEGFPPPPLRTQWGRLQAALGGQDRLGGMLV